MELFACVDLSLVFTLASAEASLARKWNCFDVDCVQLWLVITCFAFLDLLFGCC